MSECLNKYWYVFHCASKNELAIEQHIKSKFDVVTFVPIHKVRKRTAQGKFTWVELPALTTYIFVNTTDEICHEIHQAEIPAWIMPIWADTEHGHLQVAATVPDKQMLAFIQVAGCAEQRATYIDPSKFDFKEGDLVRVIGGNLVGLEGYYMQTSGKHEKRVVVRLTDFLAVATVAIPAKFVERINKRNTNTTDGK